jgi:hypothetical protein
MSHIYQVATDQVSIDRRVLNNTDLVVVSTKEHRRLAASAIADELTSVSPGILLSASTALSTASGADVEVATITPGFPGKIVATFVIASVAAITAADVDMRVDINGTNVDGGGFKLTHTALAAIGDIVPGALVQETPDAYFDSDDVIQFDAATVTTAFIDGSALFGVLVAPRHKEGAAVV